MLKSGVSLAYCVASGIRISHVTLDTTSGLMDAHDESG